MKPAPGPVSFYSYRSGCPVTKENFLFYLVTEIDEIFIFYILVIIENNIKSFIPWHFPLGQFLNSIFFLVEILTFLSCMSGGALKVFQQTLYTDCLRSYQSSSSFIMLPIVLSSGLSVLLTPGLLGISPLAQLVKELDLRVFLCVIRSPWDRLPAEPINNLFPVHHVFWVTFYL